jgi:hypothetical protein
MVPDKFSGGMRPVFRKLEDVVTSAAVEEIVYETNRTESEQAESEGQWI